jgi:molybdopterin-containing oxidoreductase family iron-sulfur binding subunit
MTRRHESGPEAHAHAHEHGDGHDHGHGCIEEPARPSPVYWRSPEHRAGDPSVLGFEEREFPEGAAELPEGVSRRTLMQLVGASLSLAGLAACRRPVERIVPWVRAPELIVPGVPRAYATTLPWGLDALGLLATSHEGRPTKLEGNELHPASLGATSAWAQAAILDLYDPDRSQQVRQGGQPSTWQAFVDAWRALETVHLADGGAGLAVVTRPFASPTLARLFGALRARFPQVRVVAYEPVGDEQILRGLQAATGAPALPLLHPERARVVVAIDSDFLHTGTGAVVNARRFADGRRIAGTEGTMSRLWSVESVHSLTGANAEHRQALRSGEIAYFVAALGARLGVDTGLVLDAGETGFDRAWLDSLAGDLEAHRGASLIDAGRRQSPAVHAAVHALNQALGNVGVTVDYARPVDAALPDAGGFASLIESMRGGGVSTLFLLGVNPVYDAPAALDLASALAAVKTTIHLGLHADETAATATWHLPEAHFLEAWGDARALDGTLSVVQPLIAPLYGARSTVELVALLAAETAPAPVAPAAVAAGAATAAPTAAGAPATAAPSTAPEAAPAGRHRPRRFRPPATTPCAPPGVRSWRPARLETRSRIWRTAGNACCTMGSCSSPPRGRGSPRSANPRPRALRRRPSRRRRAWTWCCSTPRECSTAASPTTPG